ncbi:MAG: L,D-transpeptidase [Myxococcales bacterium]|nr:L,D-transpeptidase [Myxococcales bacterium]MCB9548212.1 L,D-transpeptidase [Myxococcales bacterium]
MRRASLFTLFGLAVSLTACDATDVGGGEDVNETGGVATTGGGNPFDQEHPGEVGPDLSKADGNAYVVPVLLPPLENPHIVVSLAGFTVELIDEATGFHKVYPTGVGARGSNGRSYTPVGEFTTHPDVSNSWFWYPRRYQPAYFDGLPFMRITARNSAGNQTYGFHGPITQTLQRGYVSHGCMRMRAEDIIELYYIMREHPGAKVKIQAEKRLTPEGSVVDVTPRDQDPVAAYRAGVCADWTAGAGEAIEAGTLEEQILCEGKASYTITVAAGERVNAQVAARGPVRLEIEGQGALDGADSRLTDGAHVADASLRFAEAGEVTIRVIGAATLFDLAVSTVPLGQAEPVDGWIGDGCGASLECGEGELSCLADLPGGLCTDACERFCPDRAGAAGTFCVDLGFSDGGRCVATCGSDADCRDGYACQSMPRYNEAAVSRSVCVPTR